MPKKARPIAKVLKKDVPRPTGSLALTPVYGPPCFTATKTVSPQLGEVLMWEYCYTPIDLHPSYDSRDPDPDGRWLGIDEFYALLGKRCWMNRSQAAEAMNIFNKWWDKQTDGPAAVKAIWG